MWGMRDEIKGEQRVGGGRGGREGKGRGESFPLAYVLDLNFCSNRINSIRKTILMHYACVSNYTSGIYCYIFLLHRRLLSVIYLRIGLYLQLLFSHTAMQLKRNRARWNEINHCAPIL